MSLGTYKIDIDNSEAEAAMARLESRAESLVSNLEKAATLMSKLEQPESTATETEHAGPTASMTLTAWTPEAGAAVVSVAQGHAECVVDEGRIDPLLMGISEISGAARDLAEATRAVGGDDSLVVELIEDVTKALHARVKALASPPSEPDAQS